MKNWVAIFVLLTSTECLSQNQRIRFEKIGHKEGLSSEQTTCVFQDHQGFIWIGTAFGLNRFDGIHCKTYFHDSNDTNSLIHNQVLSIVQDKENNFWIGTQEGVSCLNPVTGKFTNYSATGKGIYYFPQEHCHTYVDKENNIWIGHNAGVSVIQNRNHPLKNIPLQLNPPGVVTNKFVTSFLHDSKDRFWVSTSYGIKLIDRKTFDVTEYKLSPNTEANACQQIIEDSKGKIFAGTWGGGILIFDEQKNIFYSRQFINHQGSVSNVIHDVLPVIQNNTDYLFLGSEFGLIKIKTDGLLNNQMQFDVSKPDKLDPESLSGTSIWGLIQDRSGNIWIATKGVNKIDLRKQGIHTYRVSADPNFQNVPAIMCDDMENENNAWIGMGGLFSYNKTNNQFNPVKMAVPVYVIDIIRGKEYYWLATNNGLLQCDKKMEIKKAYKKGIRSTDINTNMPYSLCEDHEGKIWIGTAKRGINVLDPASGIVEKYLNDTINPQSNPFINKIIEDRRHNVWIGTTEGLYRYNRGNKTFELFRVNLKPEYNALADNILCIKETKDGKIYAGSRQGLRYYDYSKNSFTQVSITSKRLSNYISGIVEDNNGMLWLGTNNGMIQYNPVANLFKLYTANNGLDDNDATNLFAGDKENNIYIGTPGKLTIFNPQQLLQNQFAPAPLITDVFIDNNAVSLNNNKNISVRHDQGISFNFVSLNYTEPENNQYAYKLNGITGDWVSLGNNRNLLFPSLPAGNYTLQLKAANNDGVWNKEITTFDFIVTPPFWKTWWFISILIIVIAASVYALYRYRLNQLLRLEKLRTRIATDLHDDIGSTLSSISFYSEAVKQKAKEKLPEVTPTLEKMGETSRKMVTSMSDIVWAINPVNDDMEKILLRMQGHAAELCAIKNVVLHVDADERARHLKFGPEHRKNIYLVFKEALNNALKYADCENIWLTVQQKGNRFLMQIRDDGKGFNTAGQLDGNGLNNMKRRAADIGGVLTITSHKEQGTLVEMLLP